jgi:hypothetical protein
MSDPTTNKPKPWYERARAGELRAADFTNASTDNMPVTALSEKLASEFRRSRASVVTLDLNVTRIGEPAARATMRQAAALCGIHPDNVILEYDAPSRIMRMAHKPF